MEQMEQKTSTINSPIIKTTTGNDTILQTNMSTYEISKSSLLSLKAEILRKQDELSKVRVDNRFKTVQHLKRRTPLDIKNKGVEQRIFHDHVHEEDLFRKSRAALIAKSQVYDKLSRNPQEQDEEQTRRYLVQFSEKSKERNKSKYESSESEEDLVNEHAYEPASNPDDEWVEYTDCLGRTRKCLRKDLSHIKSNDAELKSRVESKQKANDDYIGKETHRENEKYKQHDYGREIERHTDEEDRERNQQGFNESSEMLSSDMRRELMRKQWEKEEEEIQNKSNVHYQDILFSEARSHGVGYYGFSKDEDERRKQQEALKNLRQDTTHQQRRAQELKQLREKQLKVRIKAAKNRKRARMGLPPEEDAENDQEEPQQQQPEKVEETEEDKQKSLARQQHVRPWDVGKEGVKKHYVYTQDEWIDKKREERSFEFAPPSTYRKTDPIYESESKSLYFTTKKKVATNKHREKHNMEHETGTNPYVYETSRTESVFVDDKQMPCLKNIQTMNDEDTKSPCTYKYSMPSSKRVKLHDKKPNVEESIDAGLKFLRMQTE